MFAITLFVLLSLQGAAGATGKASWYGPGFHGKLTANGTRYNMHAMTAAHKTLPFGTKVKVTNLKNGKSTTVCIDDRGPYAHDRIIDLSKTANSKLNCNLCNVKLKILYKPSSWQYGKNVCQ